MTTLLSYIISQQKKQTNEKLHMGRNHPKTKNHNILILFISFLVKKSFSLIDDYEQKSGTTVYRAIFCANLFINEKK